LQCVATAAEDAPEQQVQRAEAVQLLHRLLDELTNEKREVFVLAELEQMPGAEIAEVCGLNINTVFARLRAARRDFNRAVVRHRAQQQWRTR